MHCAVKRHEKTFFKCQNDANREENMNSKCDLCKMLGCLLNQCRYHSCHKHFVVRNESFPLDLERF